MIEEGFRPRSPVTLVNSDEAGQLAGQQGRHPTRLESLYSEPGFLQASAPAFHQSAPGRDFSMKSNEILKDGPNPACTGLHATKTITSGLTAA